MTIQDWGAIGEIAGALLVGFTLIYLAIQLRQNTVSVETSALSGWIKRENRRQRGIQQARRCDRAGRDARLAKTD